MRKGELIAEIDPRELRSAIFGYGGGVQTGGAEAERVIELYKRNSVPVNDYDKAVSGLQQITAKYKAHQNALQDTRMLAPSTGISRKNILMHMKR